MEASGFLSGGDAAGASVVPTATVTTVLEVTPTIVEENAAAESTPMLNARVPRARHRGVPVHERREFRHLRRRPRR